MWFKNLRIYRFTQPFQMTAEALADSLSQQAFVPCSKQGEFSYGPERWQRTTDLLSRSVHVDISPDLTPQQVEQIGAALQEALATL